MTEQWFRTSEDALISGPSPVLWMITTPSFPGLDSAVELDRIGTVEDDPDHQTYSIRWTESKVNIWYESMRPVRRNAVAFRPPRHFKTVHRQGNFPSSAAQEILKAWLHMLQEVRYPSESEYALGVDGTAYRFFAQRSRWLPMEGIISRPDSGPTKMLVDLGEDLTAYAKASDEDRPALLAKCVDEAKAIQAYEYK